MTVIALLWGLLPTTSGSATVVRPVLGRFVVVAPVSGKVFVTVPGKGKARLSAGRRLPVGSSVDVSGGVVKLIAANGTGGTYTGRFGKGRFKFFQQTQAGAPVEIVLIGKPRPCARTAAAGPEALPARSRRPRHPPKVFRQLQITANENFVIAGSNLSAVASGQAVYSLEDQCDGTHIVDQKGKVQARGKRGVISLQSQFSLVEYCQPPGGHAQYCLELLTARTHGVATFAILLEGGNATSWQLCYTTPKGTRLCNSAPLDPRLQPEAGDLVCFINDGPGQYKARWFVAGRQLGVTLRFDITAPARPYLGSDSCKASIDNLSP